jgi:hypothetical protein
MHPHQPQERAEALFKKKQERLREGEKAMAEYQAERRAIIEKTARLRALRLARDATPPRSAEGTAKTTAPPKKTKKRLASPSGVTASFRRPAA